MKKSVPHLLMVLFAALALSLSSCSRAPQGELELNKGEKWKINAEMMPPLAASQKLISAFAASDKKEYKVLAEKLAANNKTLISSCTMSGKSHDELHKWLHPYLGMVGDLSDADDANEANETFQKIEASFKTFNQHFE